MKFKLILLTELATLGLTATTMAQNICQTIGTDSLSLYQNQYYTGPGLTGASCTIHTATKWINTTGADSIYFKTIQHRLYDNSKIYDENNQLIWSWNGESVPSITWYTRYHTLNISGNDRIRIEVYQGYNNFSITILQLLNIYCSISGINPPNNLNTLKVFPNPASTHITIDYGNFNDMSGYTLTIVNSIGQTVFTTPINQQTSYIDLSTWTGNGIYFVQLIDPQNNTIENRKIVIQ